MYFIIFAKNYKETSLKPNCMKSFFSLFLLCIVSIVFVNAQTTEPKLSQIVTIQIRTMSFDASNYTVQDFIRKQKITVENQSQSDKSTNITFLLTANQYAIFDTLLPKIGNVISKNISTSNYYDSKQEIELELTYLQNQKTSYEVLLASLPEKNEQYITIWNELRKIDDQIFQKEKRMLEYNYDYKIELNIYDDLAGPSSSKVSFVNMPGFEYSFLQIENPLPGLSYDMYQGYFLKYLFTRGKSYANIGAYKTLETDKNDSTAYSELFVLSFGQDFYSRYLGRGNKKTMNLYSSYAVGGILATSDEIRKNYWFISPSIGVELFKTKYILIDTKVSYFLPLSLDNRNLRGLSYNASFNFVF